MLVIVPKPQKVHVDGIGGKKFCGTVVQWLSLLHNFTQLSLNLGSVQVQVLLVACWRFAMLKISDNGPDWK